MAAFERVKILSIDGGGIRGIIPAVVLAEIERRTGRRACELFDLMAGTSTGGIIALGVAVPDPKEPGRPRWSAQDLVGMYEEEGPKIFHHSLLRTIDTVDGLFGERYDASGLEAALSQYMGEARLPQALTRLLITSYDIQHHEPFFFKSFTPDPHPTATAPREGVPRDTGVPPQPADYPMRTVARATSAAPTYFEPADVTAVEPPPDGPPDYVLVDGGTFANNPAMCAYAEAARNHPGAEQLIVSLGTGRLTESISYERAQKWGLIQWAHPLLDVMMDGASAAVDYQLDQLLGADRGHYRMQTVLAGVSDSLDDASPANIKGLRKLAEEFLTRNAARVEQVCERLTANP
ncbi:MAG TPA: patatin-like phospholipase family protein [Solirubrobacteraceae bacterium]|jgi:patatin-like phospholipase/acyl hydrolase|nr:patatin-like phospholipase family protein [Solirubrobacteraceae bacterium]